MKIIKYILAIGLFFMLCESALFAQEAVQKPVSEMSREEILDLSYDNLLALSFEDLMLVADKMEMSADELLEFFLNKDVTSASKRAEKSLNSPLSSTVISRQEIENSGATCIPEALRMVPGVIVREKTPGNYDVHIRGNDNLPPKGMFVYSENSITLVMIDGRPVYNYAFGGTFWETLPIELNDVERIEVIRGPSSALYGPNAVSAAISIFTKKVTEKKLHVNGQAQLGNNNAKLANLSVSKGITDKFKVRISGNYTYLERFEDDYYVFDYNKKYPVNVIDTLTLPDGRPIEKDFHGAFENTSLATEKFGINAFLSYDISKKANIDLAVGTQQSEAVSNTLGNNFIPIIPRTSNTSYIDLRSSFYGFQFQANYMFGDQDYQKTYQGWHVKPQIFNSTLEYEYTLGKLVLRPGISYQTTTYDDSEWGNAELKDGFLNGPKTISSVAGFLRADYKMFDKLRLIGAIRADKYNKPEDLYPSFQFGTSYDINKNNVVRAVYSRANRGPFVSDTYADYYWQLSSTNKLHYEGNQDLNLPTMNMVEIGYRSKLTKRIMLEVEIFHSEMSDIVFWTPDSLTLYTDLTPMMSGQAPTYNTLGHGQYQNNDLKSVQNGITASVNVVINSKLNFKVYGTYQESKLTGFYPRTIWNDFSSLQAQVYPGIVEFQTDIAKIMGGDNTPFANPTHEYKASVNFRDYPTEELDNDATPSFYGGAMVDYTPTPKWNINSSLYYYSAQTMLHNKIDEIGISMPENLGIDGQNDPSYINTQYTDMYKINSKAILNLKVTYKFYKDHSVFVNTRNLLNDTSREFAFLDEVNAQYYIGLNINF